MFSITQVSQPCFQCRGVIFLDDAAIGEDGCCAGHGGPLAGLIEKGDVDVGVRVDV
jgi:hypothetical protein